MTTSRINIMAQAILLHTKLCKMYRIYCLNHILNESQVNMKNTNFVTSLLRCNQLFLEWVQIVKYFYTHCKWLTYMKRDMLFPTKFTSLINPRRLIDSASLENHHNSRRNSGSHKWPKTFFSGVCQYSNHGVYRCITSISFSKGCEHVKMSQLCKLRNILQFF